MNKTFRFILLLLFLPVVIAAFYVETRFQLTSSGHKLIQILIMAGTCWLAWRWVIYDEMCTMKEAHLSQPARYHDRITPYIEDADTVQNEPVGQRFNGTAMAGIEKTPNSFHDVNRILPMDQHKATPMNFHISPAYVIHAMLSISVVLAMTATMLLIGSKLLGEGTIAVLYLVPISWCTARWGRIAGISAAVTAALSFDFLFIPPYGTFTIGSLEGWLLFFLFIATAILVVGKIHSALTEAKERERKATFLYEMVAAMASQSTPEGIARSIVSQIQQKYLAKNVQLHLVDGGGNQPITAYAGKGRDSTLNRKPDRALAIVSGPVLIGEIDIWKGTIPLPTEDDLMIQTMLKQTAAAFKRVGVAGGKPTYPQQKSSHNDGNSLQTSHY